MYYVICGDKNLSSRKRKYCNTFSEMDLILSVVDLHVYVRPRVNLKGEQIMTYACLIWVHILLGICLGETSIACVGEKLVDLKSCDTNTKAAWWMFQVMHNKQQLSDSYKLCCIYERAFCHMKVDSYAHYNVISRKETSGKQPRLSLFFGSWTISLFWFDVFIWQISNIFWID